MPYQKYQGPAIVVRCIGSNCRKSSVPFETIADYFSGAKYFLLKHSHFYAPRFSRDFQTMVNRILMKFLVHTQAGNP